MILGTVSRGRAGRSGSWERFDMFDPTTLTGFHTWLSIIAIITGVIAVAGLVGGSVKPFWTEVFLLTAVLTSVTGYFFPFHGVLPSHIVGGIALVVLAIGLYALYGSHLAGAARWIYAVCAVISLYLLVFVAVAQAFLKVPSLHALAPTGGEPPFAIAQGVVLLLFVLIGVTAVRKFRPAALAA
jgi:hypothetical protein